MPPPDIDVNADLKRDIDIAALRAMTQDAVCAALQLQHQPDGTYARSDDQSRLVLLPLGEILPWQKADKNINLRFVVGAPVALSWSADGQNAAAVHLGDGLPHHRLQENIAANVWLTAESLGQWSLIGLTGETGDPHFTPAPPDWYPTPMGMAQGEA